MNYARASGILLHPTSLPGDHGIGDFGMEAYKFIDFLAEAGQTYWQILPLGPTGYGDSPYSSFSAFAGNTLLISPEKLVEDGLLADEQISRKPDFPIGRVDFRAVYEWKDRILPLAFDGFDRSGGLEMRGEFEMFSRENASWLDDYAFYRTLKASQGQKPWFEWEDPIKYRIADALQNARERFFREILAEKFYQFLFFKQWNAIKSYAAGSGIIIAGDVPIFVASDSADVWCNQDKFKLNDDGSPTVVAGVPPDYFSKTGQLWGNPIYDWNAMRNDGFGWWVDRIKHTLRMVDVVRIDHFRGFAAAWEVPGGSKTAENGKWVDVPGEELFNAFKNEIGELPFWPEDLGVITPDVEKLRDGFGFPGMRLLQFAFGGDSQNHDLPHNYIRNCVAYTGTHDNDTVAGWLKSQRGSNELSFCLEYLDAGQMGREIHWDFIRAVWASVADTAVTPMQDVLGLGTAARMNLPASTSGNWQWRFCDGDISDEAVARLKRLTWIYGRANTKGLLLKPDSI